MCDCASFQRCSQKFVTTHCRCFEIMMTSSVMFAGQPYGPTFTTGDVIGCCINLVNNTCFYTKNGTHLGQASTPSTALVFIRFWTCVLTIMLSGLGHFVSFTGKVVWYLYMYFLIRISSFTCLHCISGRCIDFYNVIAVMFQESHSVIYR